MLKFSKRRQSVTLSNLTRAYDYALINVTDLTDYWTSAFVIYVPEIITPILGVLDCITFTPREFKLMDCINLSALHCRAYDKTCGVRKLVLTARNTCEASLTNVMFRVESLGYQEFVSAVNDEYNLTIDLGNTTPSNFTISASYDRGFSSDNIKLNVLTPVSLLFSLFYSYELLWVVIFVLALLSLFILSTVYVVERKRLRRKLRKARIESARVKQMLNKLTKDVKKTDKEYNELLKELGKPKKKT